MKHQIRRRGRPYLHDALTIEILVGDQPIELRQMNPPCFAQKLEHMSEPIKYPDGKLHVLCGCAIDQPDAIFACFACDCGAYTWYSHNYEQ